MNFKRLFGVITGFFYISSQFLFCQSIDTSYFMYVSLKGDNMINLYKLNKLTGSPEFVYSEAVAGGPASITIHPSKQYLYVAQRSANSISAYKINSSTGKLSVINTIAAIDNPVYISTDKSGKYLLSAYYNASKAAVYEIKTDGSLNSPSVKSISTGTNPHAILTDPSNKYLYITNMTGNRIEQFQFDSLTGNFTALSPAYFTPVSVIGPRHFVFYPLSNIMYAVNETGNSVTAYRYDQSTGLISDFQTISTLPASFTSSSKCADIHLTPDNRFIYASNRGHESIAGFSINQADGTLTSLGYFKTTTSPREFDIESTGNYLYSAGESSNNLSWYRINKQTGVLDSISTIPVGRTPSWVLCTEMISGITSNICAKISSYQLFKMHISPNPVSNYTTIQYFLNKTTHIKLQIFSINGELLATLKEGIAKEGLNTEEWSPKYTNGRKLNPGVYYCKLSTSSQTDSVKIIVY